MPLPPSLLRRAAFAAWRAVDNPVRVALVVLAIAWVYLFTHSAVLNNPNERTRLLQARALVDAGTLAVGETFFDDRDRLKVRDLYGRVHGGQFVNDLALVCHDPALEPPRCAGTLFPAKPPGAALLAYPALRAANALHKVPDGPDGELRATWVARYFGVALPMLLCLWALAALLRRAGLPERLTAKVLLAAGLGTAIFPYAIMLVGHAIAGGCVVAGVLLVELARERRAPLLWGTAAGLVTGAAVLLEYHAALMVLCLGVWVLGLARRHPWLFAGFALGGLSMLAAHAALHQAMFRSPLRTGHFFLMSQHNREGQGQGFLGIDEFQFGALTDWLLDPYMGVLPMMPWLLVGAWVGAPVLWRGAVGRLSTGAGRTMVAMPLLYLLFVASLAQWRTMNGWSIGPRYLVPVMAVAAVVAGVGWHDLLRRQRPLGWALSGLAAASVVTVAAVTAVFPQPPSNVRNPYVELALPLLEQGYGVRNLGLALGLGADSLRPFFALVVAVAVWIVVMGYDAARHPSWRRHFVAVAVAAVVAAAWLWSMERWPRADERTVASAQKYVRESAEGWHPTREVRFW